VGSAWVLFPYPRFYSAFYLVGTDGSEPAPDGIKLG
jgi:hypothetical protein